MLAPPAERETAAIRVSEVISALSYALDLTEGAPMGHAARACMIGMRLANQIGLPTADRGDLYYALLLKDAGCSSNASRLFHTLNADEIRGKAGVKTVDWTRTGWDGLRYALDHVATGLPFLQRVRSLFRVAANKKTDSRALVLIRCERGASVAKLMGFSESVSGAIRSLDEHWDGGGYSEGLRGKEIPLFSRIALLAQTLEVFLCERGPAEAIAVARRRSGRWFDPELVKAAEALAKSDGLWRGLDSVCDLSDVIAMEPEERRLIATEETLDKIAAAFAEIIDAKSPFTYRHSNGVADMAVAIARQLGMSDSRVAFIRRASLLHDLGKLGVPNSILEKPARLTTDEFETVKKHPYHSYEILRRIQGFQEISEVAGAHHERLDGTGYFRGLRGSKLSLSARVIAVADVYDALTARRPYRDALPIDFAPDIMRKDVPHALDGQCFEALERAAAAAEFLMPPSFRERKFGVGTSRPRKSAADRGGRSTIKTMRHWL